MTTSTPSPPPTLGIVGFGSFGRFAAGHLERWFRLRVWDRRDLGAEAGDHWRPLTEVLECDVVVPAIPVQELAAFWRRYAPCLRDGALVVDVASVKVRPMALMAELLPRAIDYVGLHPMFGPQSGRAGIAGLEVALCHGRGGREECVRELLVERLELRVHDMTPEEHDREMAYIQGLTHWMARALREIETPPLRLGTVAFEHLMKIEEILREDSWELFLTIERENPFVEEARSRLLRHLEQLDRHIRAGESRSEVAEDSESR